jgi:transposase
MNLAYENLSKEELIAENIQLKEKLLQAEKTISEYQFRILKLETELAELRRIIFGSRSERFVPAIPPEQTTLALETELAESKPAETEEITYTRKKKQDKQPVKKGRQPLPAHLERVKIVIEPTEDVSGLKCIGEEITEELEYEPGKMFVNQYVRPKYVKPETEDGSQQVLIGMLPSRPIEKGIPGPGLLAQILIDKYIDHLPCYRQIQRYQRLGVNISASTISEWIRMTTESWIKPLYELLRHTILGSLYLQCDETTIKVLDREKKGKTHLGYYWVYHSPLTNIALFEYKKGRNKEAPKEMFRNYKGRLQTDGYAAYECLESHDIKLFCCMAHARRYFDQALNNDKVRAEFMLTQIQELYTIESQARKLNLTYQQRYELRQKESLPILKDIETWLKNNITQVLPKSPIGEAIAYSLVRWEKLAYYASDGEVEIDNNLVENAIRPVALGRKNYLFAGSHEAAQRAAMVYSLFATCKKNNIEPYNWLKEVLTKIPDTKARELHSLLPLKENAHLFVPQN